MKIDYITPLPASDVSQWSGLNYYIAKSLEISDIEVNYIDSYIPKQPKYTIKQIYYKIRGLRYKPDRNKTFVRNYNKRIELMLSSDADIIFAPSSLSVAFLESKKPKVFYTDATFASMIDYYEGFDNLCNESSDDGNQIEQLALNSCSMAIYSSEWAANSARDFYGTSMSKLEVVPFGANIDSYLSEDQVINIINGRPKDHCNLLLLGVDWKRKGGDMALSVTKRLNELGLKTTLRIVGIDDLPEYANMPFVKSYGFVNKNSNEGRILINELIQESHFLIVPSTAEAFGVVFCEASSFGVPSLATKTGGIPSAVTHGLNGYLFDLESTSEEYANYVLSLFGNYPDYVNLSMSSFKHFQRTLNWKTAGDNLRRLLERLV